GEPGGGGPGGPGGPGGGPGDVGSPDGPGFQGPGGGRGNTGGGQSAIDVTLSDKAVLLHFDFLWNEEKYRKNVYATVLGVANQLKGRMAVLSGETTWHDLSAAFPKMTA